MSLSWNEVRDRAIRFSHEWTGVGNESAEAQTFWNEFFEVFGVRRRAVASFEEPVRNIRGHYGFIDLFWSGVVLVEHKAFGADLGRATSQAFNYIQDLAREGRLDEIPRYVIVSDFARVALHDLEPEEQRDLPLFAGRRVRSIEFPLDALHQKVREFAFLKGEQPMRLNPEDPANERAYTIMAELHDALKAGGYSGHPLERFLVRVLFCLFAEDTGIFEPRAFTDYILRRTRDDGSDLGVQIARLFQVLDTPPDRRQRNLDEELAAFPYVNGDLFKESLPFADFNRDMRNALLRCTNFTWSRISPAVFGSLFQGIMEARERRQVGGHYTSERDIMKVVRSLFLDDLRAELDAIKSDRSTRRAARLEEFHRKLCALHFLDPACGCGNFLVITYRELRLLELEVLKELFGAQHEFSLDEINRLSQVDVDQFYGIELFEWPTRIAEVALWLMDHQMNLRVTEAFGQRYQRLPLKKSPTIVCGNALRLDWKTILPPQRCNFVLGNPPFVGHQWRTTEQQQDVEIVWGNSGRFGRLDYVTCWYRKTADYIQSTPIRCAFVSTNSISQGEQVGILWGALFECRIQIDFAHRSFGWVSEARGAAHVDVVIIGFSQAGKSPKRIYDYDADPRHEQAMIDECPNISPYLVIGPDLILPSRTSPREGFPQMYKGSQPTDGGYLILTNDEKQSLLREEPSAEQWLHMYIGGEELINGGNRWCLWLKDAAPSELRKHPRVMERVAKVRESRLQSPTASVRQFAEQPTLFTQDRQPSDAYLAVPEVSSENRRYIPIAFLPATVVASNKLQIIVGATVYHFGVLSSTMHMAWVRVVSGRLESRLSYAPSVYNNYPWPRSPTEKQRASVESAAKAVLEARAAFPNATLADLYDPLAMPPALRTAHERLDRTVERCYRAEPFASDRQRVEYLFGLYEKLTAPLVAAAKGKKRSRLTGPR